MQLESIAIRLRRRNAWEALDLGHAMLRAWAAPAYRAWAATYWLVGVSLLLLMWPWQGFAFLILWWLKPAFDRALLFAFSRSLFGTATSTRDVWRALPGLLRAPGLLSALTVRRFSLARSFLLPVWQLEEQRGKTALNRFKVLSRRTRGKAVWLTFACANLVPVLGLSLIYVTDLFIPGDSSPLLRDLFSGDLSRAQMFAANLFFMAAESLVEPLYVASGFALYLNRRSELEGWDIELAFRRLAARGAGTATRLVAVLATSVVFSLSLLAAPEPARAAAQTQVSRPKQVIAEVLADPVFGQQTEEMRWQPRPKDGKPGDMPEWLKPYLRAIEFLSEALRGLVWVGALLLAAFLIYLLIRYGEGWRGKSRGDVPPPDFLFGLDVRPGSLPADVAAAARAALSAGRIEEALSILYRGALVALIHRLQVEFRAGDTEEDCLRRVGGKLEDLSRNYFAGLLAAWRAAAYAHEPPPSPQLEALCRDWPRHFGTVTPRATRPEEAA
jgi:hypothetical protein